MPSRRRRLLIASAAGAALLALVVCWYFGWNPFHADAGAEAVLADHGGYVHRDPEALGHPIIGVSFPQVALTDEELRELAPYLLGLRWLRDVDLRDTRVTDAGLAVLAGLKLRSLILPDKARTDLGLKHYLALVEPAETLNLFHWSITDAGLKQLAGQSQLKYLSLAQADITDAGLKELAGLKLGQFIVPDKVKTDLGLKHYLALLEPKSELVLARWNITDASVAELAQQHQLAYLDLSHTQVTEAGVKQLQKVLPGCQILR